MRSRTARITTLCATSPKVSKPECDKDGAECASLLAPIEKTQPPLPGFMSVARRTRAAQHRACAILLFQCRDLPTVERRRARSAHPIRLVLTAWAVSPRAGSTALRRG